jgi:translation initiation factor eIF-2B subunit delta
VAMLAKENRIPVVAACETYKFGERVLLDAVTGNELGKQRELSTTSGTFLTRYPTCNSMIIGDASSLLAQEDGDIPTHLTPIHLLYDLTPAALITAICSEVGFIPVRGFCKKKRR